MAATFGWLCVETLKSKRDAQDRYAATFGWLCVETDFYFAVVENEKAQPPSGGCVLKLPALGKLPRQACAATFGWLCVETTRLRSGTSFK